MLFLRIDELYTTHAWTQGGKVKNYQEISFLGIARCGKRIWLLPKQCKETNDFGKKVNQELEAYQRELSKRKRILSDGIRGWKDDE